MIYIYGLVESGKSVGQIRYIGITTDADQRLHQHRIAKENTSKGRWITDLRKSGKSVDMVLLDSAATRDEAHIKENAWILFARSRGWQLTNGTDPGEHRAMLESEIASIEDVVTMVSKLMTENAAIKENMLREIEIERKNNNDYQKVVDAHFRKWYRLSVAIVLTALSIGISVWLMNDYAYQDAIQGEGWIGATAILIGVSTAYPCIAFVLWFFLKDVPFYRPRACSKEWVSSLNEYEMLSYEALKRISWHAAGTAAILGAIALFGG